MASSHSNGNQTAVITTEYTLGTITTAGVYELNFAADTLADGDELNLVIEKRIAGDAAAIDLFNKTYVNAQGEPLIVSIPVTVSGATNTSAVFKFTQGAGTGRNFVWEIVSL